MFDAFTLAVVTDDLTGLDCPEAADAIEFRLDHATAPIEQLEAYTGDVPIIATNRSTEEGGEAAGPQRIETLEAATRLADVKAVDIELAALERGEGSRVQTRARETDTKVIVSWHDFEGTPDRPVLFDRLKRAATLGDVGKAAVTARSVAAVPRLLSVTNELSEGGYAVATMAMGAPGRHSRAIAPLYGSKIGYAPVTQQQATAPGQLDLQTLDRLVSELNHVRDRTTS